MPAKKPKSPPAKKQNDDFQKPPGLTVCLAVVTVVVFVFAFLLLEGCAITKTETDMIKTKKKEIIHRDYRDKYFEPTRPRPVRVDSVNI